MQKLISPLVCGTLVFSLILSSCKSTDDPDTSMPDAGPAADPKPAAILPIQRTDANGFELYMIPDEYLKGVPEGQRGTVETLTYHVESYAVEDQEGLEPGTLFEDKKLYVYLPAGYDPEKPCDILYLLHGSNETVEYWFYEQKMVGSYYRSIHGIDSSTWTMNHTLDMLDHLFSKGVCQDLIIVTPSYFSTLRGENDYGDSIDETMFWLDSFEQELRRDIIPLVESTYLTYAGRDTSAESLSASRDHRAIAGFSRGSRFITRIAMQDMLDVFSYYGTFHGCQSLTAGDLRTLLEANPEYPIRYWYNGYGVKDVTPSVTEQRTLCETVQDELTDLFVDGINFVVVDKPEATHHYDTALLDLYNFCHVLFQDQGGA